MPDPRSAGLKGRGGGGGSGSRDFRSGSSARRIRSLWPWKTLYALRLSSEIRCALTLFDIVEIAFN